MGRWIISDRDHYQRRNQYRHSHYQHKEIKQEPKQKIQPRSKRDYRKDDNKSTNYGGTTQKKNDCGFCGQQNWTSEHECPAKTLEYNNSHKIGLFARLCRSKTENTKRKRVNYLEGPYNDGEIESEPEVIQQIAQINRIFPDDRNEIELKSTERTKISPSIPDLRSR